MNELVHYRAWQKVGAIAAGVVYGISLSGYSVLSLHTAEMHYQVIVIRKKLSSWLEYYGLCYT